MYGHPSEIKAGHLDPRNSFVVVCVSSCVPLLPMSSPAVFSVWYFVLLLFLLYCTTVLMLVLLPYFVYFIVAVDGSLLISCACIDNATSLLLTLMLIDSCFGFVKFGLVWFGVFQLSTYLNPVACHCDCKIGIHFSVVFLHERRIDLWISRIDIMIIEKELVCTQRPRPKILIFLSCN
jgi:hypothetical protein